MRGALWVLVAIVVSCECFADPWKARTLPPAEEKAWIETAKALRTADGATVLQVLRYAEQLRPKRFKVGSFGIGYNGGDGRPETVTIDYWIGLKRLPDDAASIMMDARRGTDGRIVVAPHPLSKEDRERFGDIERREDTFMQGRDAFLRMIDGEYDEQCVDDRTKRKLC